jgi:predicted nucleic acid-binding protein
MPVDAEVANPATAFGARYSLRAADAVHLAIAVGVGADRFVTNNRLHCTRAIVEIDVTYPDDLSVG